MPIYIVVPLVPSMEKLSALIEEHVGANDRFKLQANRGWLVKFPGTTTELSNVIGVTGHPAGSKSASGSTIIVPVPGYYGVGPSDMWEWLKTRMEE
jgi:hypothetical protein